LNKIAGFQQKSKYFFEKFNIYEKQIRCLEFGNFGNFVQIAMKTSIEQLSILSIKTIQKLILNFYLYRKLSKITPEIIVIDKKYMLSNYQHYI
jgi:hypothetical protein